MGEGPSSEPVSFNTESGTVSFFFQAPDGFTLFQC